MSVANNISFNNFCQLCTKISEANHDKRKNVLFDYIEKWKAKAKDLVKSEPNVNDSFYPVMRFLLPHLDRERGAYGIKEHTLAKIYIRILSLPKDSRDAIKFLEYRAPKTGGGDAGDFAEIAYWILKKRCADGCQLSIEDVNKHLDTIAAKHALGEPREVDSKLILLLKSTSAEEQKWLIRILLKEMKLGLGQNSILSCYHPDARSLYDASNDLKKVCDLLKNPEIRLHEVEIELFSPAKPMLSEECDIQKLDSYLKRSNNFFIETKLDGERFQLHMKENEFKYFSRNGYDYTSNFGSSRNEGILTPRIADQIRKNVKTCILDGEMMSWDTSLGTFASKAQNLDVKNLKNTTTHEACFCVFDVLFYNDQILTNKPLFQRIEILNEIILPLEGAIVLVPRKKVSSKEEIIDSLNEAIDNREEGIVMKEFDSVYKPNIRKNGGWFKIKPEYVDGLSNTLDLLIIGGYFGSGRHKGNISHFLLGVAVKVDEESKLFYSVGRVGSGYSTNELSKLQKKLEPFWKRTKVDEMPPCIEWTKEKPDVWIEPEKSFILEVKAAEITSSIFFKTGFSLRFPRVEKVRYDKSWKDCMTLEEFEEKRKEASGKLASQHTSYSEAEEPKPKKRILRSNFSLGDQYKGIDATHVECVSNLLSGKEICVFTGFDNVKKSDVEKKIVEHGGTLVQNPGKSTFCVLAESDSTVRIKNLIKCGSHDIIRTSWFYSQLWENRPPELQPGIFIAMSLQTKETFSNLYDEYGDHYTIPSTRASIEFPLNNAGKNLGNSNLSVDEKYDMDVELFGGPSPYSLFRLCVAYFDQFPILEDSTSGLLPFLQTYLIDFQFGGGRVSDVINKETTHVVVFSGDLSRLEELKRRNRKREKRFHVVSENWISSCVQNKSLLETHDFIL